MTDPFDPELHTPREETPPAEEFPIGAETAPPGDEFNASSPPLREEDRRAERRGRTRRTLLLQTAAVLSTVVVAESAFGYDLLGSDFLADKASQPPEEPPPVEQIVDTSGPGVDDPNAVIDLAVHVTYVPTGEEFFAEGHRSEALYDAEDWVSAQGGDPETMVLLRSVTTYVGRETSDDLIIVGSGDDLEHAYIAQGSISFVYREERWYEAYEAETAPSAEQPDEAFPQLTNLWPNGAVSLPEYGLENVVLDEEFVIINNDGTEYYLVCGRAHGGATDTLPGTVYDAGTNTLTLTNFTGGLLNVNMMGNGFTLRLVGENQLDGILIWGFYSGGSLTITGNGSLTVTGQGKQVGILLNAECSQTCLMIDSGVTLDVSGEECAVYVQSTSMEQGIYYLRPLSLTGGVRDAGTDAYSEGFRDYTILQSDDPDGGLAVHVVFAP